jgi:hypothetical protein
MVIDWRKVKQANSKGELVGALKVDRMALEWYARHENWTKVVTSKPGAEKESFLWVWKGDNYPPYAAEVTLGTRKPDPNYRNNWQLEKEARDGRNETDAKS